ncbi:MAG: ribonuclease P protein component [bacterium]|nr:ribonuclease P protein component [bacterium]
MPSDPRNFRFPGEFRIKSTLDFERYFKEAQVKAGKYLVLRYIIDKENITRLGLSITKRGRNSVKVNRLKRLAREVFRINRNKIIPHLQLIVSFRKQLPAEVKFEELEKDFLNLLKLLNLLEIHHEKFIG